MPTPTPSLNEPITIQAFSESHALKVLTPAVTGAEGSEWEVVMIEVGKSLNGTFYEAKVLRDAVQRGLFEGVKAASYLLGGKQNHVPTSAHLARPGGFSENTVGWFDNVRFGRFTDSKGVTGEGVLGRFHVLEAAEWLRLNLLQIFKAGRPELLGFSIDAQGQARDGVVNGERVRVVERIDKINETTVVSEPAAGGRAIRLVASLEGPATTDAVLEQIRNFGEYWFREIHPLKEGETGEEYLLRVIEANLARAEIEQRGVNAEEQPDLLKEVARGVNTLSELLRLIAGGKTGEAMALVRNWLSVYKADDQRSAESHKRGRYSFPYSAPSGEPVTALQQMRESTMTTPTNPAPAATDELAAERAKLAERDAALVKRENALLIQEKVNGSDLPDEAKKRLTASLTDREGLTPEIVESEITTMRDFLKAVGVQEANPAPAPAAPAAPAPAPALPAVIPAVQATVPVPSGDPVPTGLGEGHGAPSSAKVTMTEYDKARLAWDGLFDSKNSIDGIESFSSLHEAFYQIARPTRHYSPRRLSHLIFEALARALPGRESEAEDYDEHRQHLTESWGNCVSYRLVEAISTSIFTVSFGDSLRVRLQRAYMDDPLNDWRKVVSPNFENFQNLTHDINIARIGGYGVLPVVNEGAPYEELGSPTEVSEKLSPKKRGGLEKLTWEAILADRVNVVRLIPINLGRAAARTAHELVWDEIDKNPTVNTTPTTSNALISAAHNNVLASVGALSYDNASTLIEQMVEQTEQDSLKKLGIIPRYLAVSPTNFKKSREITRSEVKQTSSDDATIKSFVNDLGVETLMTVGLGRATGPTTKFRYYLIADPRVAEGIVIGFLGGRDRPEVFTQSPMSNANVGEAFDADQMVFKIRYGVAAKVVDFRFIQGSLATT